jgi:hypothetical protein
MLDELRRKSPGIKNTYALWGALLVTGLVAAGWMATLPIRFSEVASEVEGVDQTANSLSEFLGEMKSEADAVLASSSLPTTDPNTWGLNGSVTTSGPVVDPILIATTSAPIIEGSTTIQIATSSAPKR